MIIIDREKAENIVRSRLREEREPLLKELDVQFIKALEVGADVTEISATKQALRDITTVDLSKISIDELSTITIEDLLKI